MALEARLAARLGADLGGEIRRQFLHDLDVRVDALGLDRTAGRREVAGGGQAERAIAAERDDRLHRALAEGPRADDGRAPVILQGAGDDFRGRGRAAIDQHDHRLAVGEVAGVGVVALGLVGVAAAGRDDLAALEEGVGDGDRLVEEAARIVAQVDDVALDLVLADRRLQLVDRRLEAVEGLFVEGGDADVADRVLLARAHRLDGDLLADQLDVERLVDVRPLDRQRDRRVDAAAHLVDRVVEGQALRPIRRRAR